MTEPVLLVMGSVRAGRRCPAIADWVTGLAPAGLGIERIDLRDWSLPMDDEPGMPQRGVYEQDHTLAWSRKVGAAPGFVVVTPQYNWGYPAPLKNAIDHLHGEWRGKPLLIVSYGGHGGGKAAAQLREVADALRMTAIAPQPQLTIARAAIEGGPFAADADLAAHADEVRAGLAALAAALAG